jgi:hypothetical protein
LQRVVEFLQELVLQAFSFSKDFIAPEQLEGSNEGHFDQLNPSVGRATLEMESSQVIVRAGSRGGM